MVTSCNLLVVSSERIISANNRNFLAILHKLSIIVNYFSFVFQKKYPYFNVIAL